MYELPTLIFRVDFDREDILYEQEDRKGGQAPRKNHRLHLTRADG